MKELKILALVAACALLAAPGCGRVATTDPDFREAVAEGRYSVLEAGKRTLNLVADNGDVEFTVEGDSVALGGRRFLLCHFGAAKHLFYVNSADLLVAGFDMTNLGGLMASSRGANYQIRQTGPCDLCRITE